MNLVTVSSTSTVESPLPSILNAASKFELTPQQFLEVIGVEDETLEADVEFAWLIYDEALKRHRRFVRVLVVAYPTDQQLARWFRKYLRPPDEDEELSNVDCSAVLSWCAGGCEIYV